ncbi:MAG: antibiotic biosynthesis monooxygenase [Clostridia bacterium]|nr:antibiotic biosynthesis monooxygenase [Clostridia bacterium]MCL6521973.1 antibiotic biosynthesis monooxygenase [Bacillota bacterium]
MTVITLHYQVQQGRERSFEEAYRKGVSEILIGMAGHRGTRLYRGVEEPRAYLVESEWQDRASLEEALRDPRFQRALAGWRNLGAVVRGPEAREMVALEPVAE